MLEKLKIKQLDFEPLKKETVKTKKLKEVYSEVFPYFSKAYKISKKYTSRAQFLEDKEFIDLKSLMGKSLYEFREIYNENGFSDDDYEFINELLERWNEWIDDFPVFRGDTERLFVFWLLSWIDRMEEVFYSEYKTTSFSELFFFEKIIDYIVSTNEDKRKINESVIEIFNTFGNPQDVYDGVKLFLNYVYTEDSELKRKLFLIFDSISKKIKTKVREENLILDKVNILIKQQDYSQAFDTLLNYKELLLKERPVEWISKIVQIKKENFNIGEKLTKIFENQNFIKEIIDLVPEEESYEFILILLYDLEIEKKEIEEFLTKILDENENRIVSGKKYNLLLQRAWGLVKSKRFFILNAYLKKYKELFYKYYPEEHIKLLIDRLWHSYDDLIKFFNLDFFNDFFTFIKSKRKRAKVALYILSIIEFKDEKIKKFLFSQDFPENGNKELQTLKLKAWIKQREFGKLSKNIEKLMINFRQLSPTALIEILYHLKASHERFHKNLTSDFLEYLLRGVRNIPPYNYSLFLFIWGLLASKEEGIKLMKDFLKKLKTINLNNRNILKFEYEGYKALKNYFYNNKTEHKIKYSKFAWHLYLKEQNQKIPFKNEIKLNKRGYNKYILTTNLIYKIQLNKELNITKKKVKKIYKFIDIPAGFQNIEMLIKNKNLWISLYSKNCWRIGYTYPKTNEIILTKFTSFNGIFFILGNIIIIANKKSFLVHNGEKNELITKIKYTDMEWIRNLHCINDNECYFINIKDNSLNKINISNKRVELIYKFKEFSNISSISRFCIYKNKFYITGLKNDRMIVFDKNTKNYETIKFPFSVPTGWTGIVPFTDNSLIIFNSKLKSFFIFELEQKEIIGEIDLSLILLEDWRINYISKSKEKLFLVLKDTKRILSLDLEKVTF